MSIDDRQESFLPTVDIAGSSLHHAIYSNHRATPVQNWGLEIGIGGRLRLCPESSACNRTKSRTHRDNAFFTIVKYS